MQAAQIYLFASWLRMPRASSWAGPIGDRIGRKYVIWLSILGALPFALAMPHLGLIGGLVAVAAAGFILSSATAAIIVFAQELMPHRIGLISGIFFGFSFGIGGLGAAALGKLADIHGIEFVFIVCSFLPAMELIGFLLPNMPRAARASVRTACLFSPPLPTRVAEARRAKATRVAGRGIGAPRPPLDKNADAAHRLWVGGSSPSASEIMPAR